MKKFHVRLPDSQFRSYECEPLSIKKKISQNVSIQYDRIILIDLSQDLNQIYQPSRYLLNVEYEEIQLQVVDLAIALRENFMLKKALQDSKKRIENMNQQIKEAKKEFENTIFLQRDQQIQELQLKNLNLEKAVQDFSDQQTLQQQVITDYENQIFAMQKQIEDQFKMIERYEEQSKQFQIELQQQRDQAIQYYAYYYQQLQLSYQELEQDSEQKLKKQKKKYKTDIEELEDKLSKQENEKNTEIENLKSELEMIKNDNQDSKQKLQTMNQQFEDIAKLRSGFKQEDCQMKLLLQANQFQDKINALKLEHQHKTTNLQEHINKQKSDIDQLQRQLNNMKKKQEKDQQEFEAECENLNQKQKVEQQKFLNQKQQLEEDLNKKQQECNKKDREKTEVDDQNQILSAKNYQLSKELTISKQQLQESQSENDGLKNKVKEYSQIIVEKEKVIKSKISVIKRIVSQNKKKPLEDIVNTYEKLYKLNFKTQIIQGSNSQWDDQKYKVFEILPTPQILKKIKEQIIYDIVIDDLKIEEMGQMEVTRSLQPNAEGEYYNIYFLVVEEKTKSKLAKQYLARKNFKSSQSKSYASLQEAATASLNQIITDALLKMFNQILTQQNVKFIKIQVPPQYVLQNGEEFYNCEQIIDQQIKKINGGEYNIGLDETSQYLNSFSNFTHTYSKKQCIVSNIFANNRFMYEMIVSTQEGCFSELDAGKREIEKTLGNMKNKSPQCYGRFYNDQIDKLAQQE